MCGGYIVLQEAAALHKLIGHGRVQHLPEGGYRIVATAANEPSHIG